MELLAVIAILAIIAAIAIPSIGNIIANSRSKAVIADAQNVLSAANIYFTENSYKDGDTVELGAGDTPVADSLMDLGFIDDAGSIKTATITKATGGNTITFTADINGKTATIPPVTMAQLNNATVTKGVITLGDNQYSGETTP